MRLYAGSSQQFVDDTIRNQIAEKLKQSFFVHYRYQPSPAEIRSWQNSLRAMSSVIENAELMDHGVLLEYQLPLSSRRLDCMVCGHDSDGKANAVIVELKQWENCSEAEGENEVLTWLGGTHREVLHPAVQVHQYQMYLQDVHPAFYEPPSPVGLSACSYLHNHHCSDGDVLFTGKFDGILKQCPLFTADHFEELTSYLQKELHRGDGLGILRRVEENRYRPSKKLMEHVEGVIRGKSEYVLLDEQLVVYDKVLAQAKKGFHDRRTSAILVRGGPGTGKSIIALNLMADLLRDSYNAHYATGSKAFTETLRKVVGARGAVQFKYFNSYTNVEANTIDVLICDESHRIRETSNNRYTPREERSGVPQVEELLNAGKVVVFLIDEKQGVRPDEIGSVETIRTHAERLGCDISEYQLETQFRCAGSEAFVSWINNTLGIEQTPNILWRGHEGFEFRIFDSPEALEEQIRQKAGAGHSARLTAGFCWEWSTDLNADGTLKLDVEIGGFKRPWNARHDATHLARGIPKAQLWAYEPGGLNQIGCVYTAQGFEFDYVGVIFGKDLIYDMDGQKWVGNKEESGDPVVRRSRDRFMDLIKNTYRVLLSRGLKGCYVYFMDKDTERFFKSRMEVAEDSPRGELIPYKNALPLLELRAVANADFRSLDGLFRREDCFEIVPVVGGPFADDRFLVRAEGDSMEPLIKNGDLCLFRKDPGGSRNGKIVLCKWEQFAGDAPLGLIKKYKSARTSSQDGAGEAKAIVLSSVNEACDDIILKEGDEVTVLGIFERTIQRG